MPHRLAEWFAASAPGRKRAGLSFWRETVLISAVYVGYSFVRNVFGSSAVAPEVAAENADWIIDVEEAMGLYIEPDVQAAFIDWTAFIQFWNLFYGVAHFLVTFVALIWLYHADPGRYRFWRRTGLVATAAAVVGYALFPLMPPRLLGDCGLYGACRPDSPYVDTAIEIGGLWSFESSGLEAVSNQYAAMPSLHIGWALWCTLILVPRLHSPWGKGAAIAYPFLTLFAIVVTANHYWIDGIGGVLVVAIGWAVSSWWEQRGGPEGRGQKSQEPSSVDSGDSH
ncbi:MAG: phosphatase PAP2 family protein [Actinomycetota bacterium]